MNSFDKRQQIRIAKRNKHSREIRKLMHKLGGINSPGWQGVMRSIHKRVGDVMQAQFQSKMTRLIKVGDWEGVIKLQAKWKI